MKQNDHDIPDELASPLDGKAVSATYREASTETPPPALDALILSKARAAAAVGQNGGNRHSSWRAAYQLAASFVVGILITVLYYNLPVDAVAVQKSVLPSAISTAEPTAVPAPADRSFLAEAPAMPAPVNAVQPRMIDIAASAGVRGASFSPSTEDIEGAEAAVGAENAASAASVTGQTAVGQRATFGDQSEQNALPQVIGLSEVVVTGSRVQRPQEAAAAYRSDRELWRNEIGQLSDALNNATVELQTLSARLVEEQALFLEAFPDSSINELSEGQSAPQGN